MLKKSLASNRWFILACALLAVNLYAVVLYTVRSNPSRDVRATLLFPNNKSIAKQQMVVFRFSADIVAEDATGTWTDDGPVALTPNVPGAYCWRSPNELMFRPSTDWPACTEYCAAIDGSLRSLDGFPLGEARLFTFRSEPLKLNRANQIDMGDHTRVRLHFNGPVAVDEISTHLKVLDADGVPVPHRLQRMSDATTADIAFDRPDLASVRIELAKGLRSSAGPIGLEEDLSTEVALSADLLVSHISTRRAGLRPGSVLVTFTAPIDLEHAAAFIRSDPPLELTLEPYYSYGSGSRYAIRGNFAAGHSYTLTFAKGLPSIRDTRLHADTPRTAYFEDAGPELQLAAEGHYMTPEGKMLIPVRLLNVKQYTLTLRQVFANNLVPLAARRGGRYERYYGDDHQGLSTVIARDTRKVAFTPNQVVENSIALRPLIKDLHGAFHLEIVSEDGVSDEHYFVVSDTGLSVRQSEGQLLVWANSLRDLSPVANADIQLFSLQNQPLAGGRTDDQGLLALAWTPDDDAPPFLVTAATGGDLTYIALDENRITEPGAAGSRPFLSKGYEACVFTDRGIYRPGSTCHIRVIVRDQDLKSPTPFPIQLTVFRPDGRSMQTASQLLSELGTAEFSVAWPDYAATGRYRLEIALPGENGKTLGHRAVQVETFVPPKIKVAIQTTEGRRSAHVKQAFTVQANHMFGSPAANLPVSADVEYVAAAFSHEKWPDYVFGDARRPFEAIREKLGAHRLDRNGKATYEYSVPAGLRPPAVVRTVLSATVTEAGGRTVTAYAGQDVDVYPFYLGLKHPPSRVPTGSPTEIEVVGVDSSGALYKDPARLSVRFEKLAWTSMLRRNADGRYRYVSEEQASLVAEETMGLSDGVDTITVTPSTAGRYRIILEEERSGTAVSHEFYAAPVSQAALAWSMEKPDRVDIQLDQKDYAPGDTAQLLIRSPFTGKALLTVETDRVHAQRVLVLTNNTCTVALPVAPAYAPNVYCTISVIRPVVTEKTWGQHRAVGRVPILVRQPERRLEVTLDALGEMRPRSPLRARLTVHDHKGAPVESEFTVAAVDEGICMLTDFTTPDPYAYFTAPRLPAISLSDIYASLMPEFDEALLGTASRPGGGGETAMRRHLNPIGARRFQPVSLWLASTRTDSNGIADVSFDVPEFTGRLRLMAVAVNPTAFGSADTEVIVRRPFIVQSGLPRFLAPGDQTEMPIQLINESGRAGEAQVTVECKGPLQLDGKRTRHTVTVPIPDGASRSLNLRLFAGETPGRAHCTISATLDEERFEEITELSVRPASALTTRMESGVVKPGSSIDTGLSTEWLPGTGETTLWLSSLPSLQLAGGLDYLVRYPHGCLEQTTSQSFPLLYLADLASELYPGWLEGDALKTRAQAGVDRVLSMQRPDGAFALWPSGSAYVWGSIYATHFLTEASKAGYAVNAPAHESALSYLEKWLARGAHGDDDGPDLYKASYACMVLARAGRPPHGWMARIREQLTDLTRGTRVNTAAAYLAAEKRRDAAQLLEGLATMRVPDRDRDIGGSLRSNERDDAILLSAWLDVAPGSALVPALVSRLEKAQSGGRWYTTQDNAMALMAMGKYCRICATERSPVNATVTWSDGQKTETVHATENTRIDMVNAIVTDTSIRNSGTGATYYYVRTTGVPAKDTAKERDEGLTVRRAFYNDMGEPMDPSSIEQGDLIVVAVELTAGDHVDNVVIEDLLPAGLEVENARLQTSKDLSWVKKMQTLPVSHVDPRDDRVLLFTSSFSGKKTYFYAVRAVTRGQFSWPAIAAECMYDEALRSRHGRRELRVE